MVWLPAATVLASGCARRTAASSGMDNMADASVPDWATSIQRGPQACPDAECRHLAQRGEVMTGGAAVEAGALPIRVFRGLRTQPGLDPKRSEQPVDIEREHVGTIHVRRVLERAGEQANIPSFAIPRPTGQARP